MTAPHQPDVGEQEARDVDRLMGILAFARDHLGVLVPPVVVAFVILKVLRVSRAQLSTAITLLSGSDKVAITTGALLPLLYILALAGAAAAARLCYRRKQSVELTLFAFGGLVAALVTAMILVPYPLLVLIPVLLFVNWSSQALVDRTPIPGDPTSGVTPILVAAVVAALLSVGVWELIDERPWVPAEVLTIDGHETVGYVVSSGEWTEVLLEKTRTVIYVRPASITARKVCETGPGYAKTLVQAIVRSKSPRRYPACPK